MVNSLPQSSTLWAMWLTWTVFAPFATASQSSLDQRLLYTSEDQLSAVLGGTKSLGERSFVTGSVTYSRTAIDEISATDHYYRYAVGGGTSTRVWGIDLAGDFANAPLTQIFSYGGELGISYAHYPRKLVPRYVEEAPREEPKPKSRRLTDPNERPKTQAQAIRPLISVPDEEKSPAFWLRASYALHVLTSTSLPKDNRTGSTNAFSADFFWPWKPELTLQLGGKYFTYDDYRGFFTEGLRNTASSDRQLLGATLQGLPGIAAIVGASWQIASRDSFQPQYQAAEMFSNKHWTHTVDLTWAHQFGRRWILRPTYEASLQGDQVFTAVILDATYLF